jgi:hypothetical protein
VRFDSRSVAGAGRALPCGAVDEGDVTAGWIARVLDTDVGDIEVERIGDGLAGMNLRVRLIGSPPDAPGSVVIKLPSPDPTSRATGLAMRNYEREVRFYREIASTVDIRVPHCHHADLDVATGDFVVVLEDMHPAEQGDQLTGCTVARAGLAIEELARLHGPRWDDASLFDVDWLGRRAGPHDSAQLEAFWTMLLPGFRATYDRYLSPDASELLDRFGAVIRRWVDDAAEPYSVTHGDFRLDNLLFGTEAGGPPVTAVDWQTPGHGPPVHDLSYFLGAGLLPPERAANERALVDRYGESMAGYDVDLDEDWLWRQYRRGSFAGVVMAVIASQIVGSSDRSEALFTAMATRHLQHALDLDALSTI